MAASSDKSVTTPKPQRRWFRPHYSLATLFVVVTAVGCWLGYSLNWIKQRHDLLAGRHGKDADLQRVVQLISECSSFSAPWSLSIFREQGMCLIFVFPDKYGDYSENERQARRLFPEAEILCREPIEPDAHTHDSNESLSREWFPE